MKWNSLIAILLCTVVTTIFSLHYIVAKYVLSSGVSPYALASWRGIGGGGILLVLFHKRFSLALVKRNATSIFFVAFLGFFINQIFFMKGLSITTPINTAIISNMIPIITFMVAVMFGTEKMILRRMIGIIISFLAVSFFLLHGKLVGDFFNLGDLFILLNVIAFCFSLVLGKRLIETSFPYEVLSALMLLGGGTMMFFVVRTDMVDIAIFAGKSFSNFLAIIFEVVLSTSIAYLLNLKALQLMSASKVAFFTYLQPVITGTTGFFLNGTVPDIKIYMLFAAILLSGYLVVTKRSARIRYQQPGN